MSRQIEIDFFAHSVTDVDTPSMSTDLFGTEEVKEAPVMELERENTPKTVKITAQVPDEKNDIFNAA